MSNSQQRVCNVDFVALPVLCCRCDREDRHRGLCNHRATIPGPAVCAVMRPKQQMEDDEQDTSSMDQGAQDSVVAASTYLEARQPSYGCCLQSIAALAPAWVQWFGLDCAGCAGVCELAAYSDVVMQCVEEAQASGGHSHNCQAPEPCAHGDEREVDSALQTGEESGCFVGTAADYPRLRRPSSLVVCSCSSSLSVQCLCHSARHNQAHECQYGVTRGRRVLPCPAAD